MYEDNDYSLQVNKIKSPPPKKSREMRLTLGTRTGNPMKCFLIKGKKMLKIITKITKRVKIKNSKNNMRNNTCIYCMDVQMIYIHEVN